MDKNQALTLCEAQLKTITAQLIVQENLAAIGLITAGIIHEIKNPINLINNFARLNMELTTELLADINSLINLINQESQENQENQDNLKAFTQSTEDIVSKLKCINLNSTTIETHGKRAENTIKTILLQARSDESTEKEATDLNALLEEYANLAYHGMRSTHPHYNITFEKNLDSSIGSLMVRGQDMGRVFLNLMNNALYAANQTSIRSPTIILTTHNSGDHIIIKIKDNGIGMTPAIQEKLFTQHFTTKPVGEGTGLGLTLVQKIIQAHHGTIRVSSAPGEYTEFTITLPKNG